MSVTIEAGKGYLLVGQHKTSGAVQAAGEQGRTLHHIFVDSAFHLGNADDFRQPLATIFSNDPRAVIILDYRADKDRGDVMTAFMEALDRGHVLTENGKEIDVRQGIFFLETDNAEKVPLPVAERLTKVCFSL